jgi:hypothetical protein
VLGLANYEVTSIEHSGGVVRISARYLDRSRARIARRRSCGAKADICAACGTKAGQAALLADPGGAQVVVPGLWPGIPPAVSRNPEVAASQHMVPADDLFPALGWD